jgi:hypothetical protein
MQAFPSSIVPTSNSQTARSMQPCKAIFPSQLQPKSMRSYSKVSNVLTLNLENSLRKTTDVVTRDAGDGDSPVLGRVH